MKICHVQGIFSPEHGGPTQSLANYCGRQVAAGHQVEVWTLEGFPQTSAAIRLPPPVVMRVFSVDAPAKLGGSSGMRRELNRAQPAEVYHLHGAWLRAMHYGAVAARCHRRPYIVEVMGMYEPWALRQKWLQKKLTRLWFQDRILKEAACIHVNSRQEADYLRALGFNRPIAVIPVGVDMEQIERQKSEVRSQKSEVYTQLAYELQGRPFILFLSRLHPKKGLDLLIHSWAKIWKAESGKRKAEDWRLVIAGTGNPAYTKFCKDLVIELGIANGCLWLGHVDELQKSWLFTYAHCYVLPTASENFGNTVAEALAHGTPVITTHHTPWTDLPSHHCGWLIDNTVEGLCIALNEAMQMDVSTRNMMGTNGKSLVRSQYSLELVCRNILAVYEWVLAGGTKPECVI